MDVGGFKKAFLLRLGAALKGQDEAAFRALLESRADKLLPPSEIAAFMQKFKTFSNPRLAACRRLSELEIREYVYHQLAEPHVRNLRKQDERNREINRLLADFRPFSDVDIVFQQWIVEYGSGDRLLLVACKEGDQWRLVGLAPVDECLSDVLPIAPRPIETKER